MLPSKPLNFFLLSFSKQHIVLRIFAFFVIFHLPRPFRFRACRFLFSSRKTNTVRDILPSLPFLHFWLSFFLTGNMRTYLMGTEFLLFPLLHLKSNAHKIIVNTNCAKRKEKKEPTSVNSLRTIAMYSIQVIKMRLRLRYQPRIISVYVFRTYIIPRLPSIHDLIPSN